MQIRVGIDLASVDAVRESIDTHADRYLERIYTAEELRDCGAPGEIDPARLAARFAAKEAAIKVLRPRHDEAVPWSAIAVRRDESGAVGVQLSGRAAELASAAGIAGLELSLTHERDLAAAVVVAELDDAPEGI